MLAIGELCTFIQIDYLVLVLIGVVGTRKRRYIEPIFFLVGAVLYSITFGVAPQEQLFGPFSPRQSNYIFYNITHFIIYRYMVVE